MESLQEKESELQGTWSSVCAHREYHVPRVHSQQHAPRLYSGGHVVIYARGYRTWHVTRGELCCMIKSLTGLRGNNPFSARKMRGIFTMVWDDLFLYEKWGALYPQRNTGGDGFILFLVGLICYWIRGLKIRKRAFIPFKRNSLTR